jgi:spore coat polysaccharide biosynthesis protein SpsF (cytidylyltransferase family)
MTVGLIVFARLDSRRLPGKALAAVGRRPLLGHVLDRARRVQTAARLVLATTDRAEDAPLAAFAAREGVACFRGALDDVAGRALACARAFGFTCFARICGDRPFFEPTLVDRLLAMHAATGSDLTTTQSSRPYPPGLTTEVISVRALERTCAETSDPEDREHLTRHFYRHADRFRIERIEAPAGLDFAGIRLVVDNLDDLERARFIESRLPNPALAGLATLLELARAWRASPTSAAPRGPIVASHER